MPGRAHFVTYALDPEGRPIPGATVSVREPDTETAISETIFAADDPDVTEKSNPFTADADGKVEIWLTAPKIVDLFVTKTGYEPSTIRAIAHQLTASDLTVAEAGTPLAQRATLNFLAGFDLVDDAGNDETEVAIDLLEVTDFTAHKTRHQDAGADEISIAGLAGIPTELQTHLDDAADAHDASAISVLDAGALLAAADVEAALAEIQGNVDTDEAALAAHLADGTDAHDASAVSFAPAAGIAAVTAQLAIEEVAGDQTAHEADATDAHDASAISILDAAGDFTATNVETALAELQADAESHAQGNHTATMIETTFDVTADAITATGDSQAGLSISAGDAADFDSVWYEGVLIAESGANAALVVIGEVHDPAHNVIGKFQHRIPPQGAGLATMLTIPLMGRDSPPAAGSYHLNITTLTVSTCTVEVRRVIGIP